ncbi:virulence factor TspB C-terminal domain-related protein [Melaminivora suipulveris]|uniref:virulence factor TspB C-terminal domain-related protein n=1 Tax=Melaminivora suipulveris TaxID=2109913 RepID=UPI00131A4B16|nr:virulence factor TspB C-terminal domain-related protein [Melaminivora suipulveris]
MRALILCALALAPCIADAAYHFPKDPRGWRGNAGGREMSRGEYNAKVVLDSITGRVIYSPNALTVPVGGRDVALNVGYKLGPAAFRAAAIAIYTHPVSRTALGISQWLGLGKLIWDEVEKIWTVSETIPGQISEGWVYCHDRTTIRNPSNCGLNAIKYDTEQQALQGLYNVCVGEFNASKCRIAGKRVEYDFYNNGPNSQWFYREVAKEASDCPAGWVKTPQGCLSPETQQGRKIETPEEFADILEPKTMPNTVPFELPPDTYLPVDIPSPWVNPSKTEYPVSLPLFVPSGNPVANPDYDPNQPQEGKNLPWITPGVKIIHAPTDDTPFRLEMLPVNRPQETKTPVDNPITDDDGSGGGNDKPRDETQDLCEKHPDIVACQKLEPPDPAKLPEKEYEFDLVPEAGFFGSGVCPPPFTVTVGGHTLSFSWQGFCDSLSLIKPLLLAFAWLGAAFIVLGARNEA